MANLVQTLNSLLKFGLHLQMSLFFSGVMTCRLLKMIMGAKNECHDRLDQWHSFRDMQNETDFLRLQFSL